MLLLIIAEQGKKSIKKGRINLKLLIYLVLKKHYPHSDKKTSYSHPFIVSYFARFRLKRTEFLMGVVNLRGATNAVIHCSIGQWTTMDCFECRHKADMLNDERWIIFFTLAKSRGRSWRWLDRKQSNGGSICIRNGRTGRRWRSVWPRCTGTLGYLLTLGAMRPLPVLRHGNHPLNDPNLFSIVLPT